MDVAEIAQVRRFNRVVTQSVGALDQSYLERGRPLGEARLLCEIGAEGADARTLRGKLGLDSGYLSRLLRSLAAQDLIEVDSDRFDARLRRATLTQAGRAEVRAYEALSNRLAATLLAPLDMSRRARLLAAMGEVERLLSAAAVEIAPEPPGSAEARRCLDSYFRELAERFEGGYDPESDRSAPADKLEPPAGLFLLARLRGEPVGCGALKRIDGETCEIKRVWVAPPARGLGLARRILHRLEAEAVAMGFALARLDTNTALTEAQALYLGEGYREIARFNDNPYAHRWFEKRLAG